MDGYILVLFTKIVDLLQGINLIEILKCISIKVFRAKNTDEEIRIKNIVIDNFVLAKWTFVILLIKLNISNTIAQISVLYLLIINIHTYFYNHFWSERAIKGKARSIEHIRRKFITLMLAIGYNVMTYAYFYNVGINEYFIFSKEYSQWICVLIHSLASTFIGGSDYLTPINDTGLIIQATQIITSFMFLGIILSKTDTLEEGENTNGIQK